MVQAKHRKTEQIVAIKFIKTKFDTQDQCKNVMRELTLLRQFGQMKNNKFITKLLDVIVAETVPGKFENARGIFLVIESVETDMQTMLKKVESSLFGEEHLKIIAYNLLCGLNFMHTANVMHRDIKTANLLVDTSNCRIKLCDFGQSRTIPKQKAPEVKMFDKLLPN